MNAKRGISVGESGEVQQLLSTIDQAYDHRSWHGTNLRGSFPLKGSNWFPRGQSANDKQWRADVILLEKMHRALRKAVANLSASDLSRRPNGSKITNIFIITGIAAHDLYHAGQIQLLKKL